MLLPTLEAKSEHLYLMFYLFEEDVPKDDYRIVFYDQRGHESSDKSTVHMNVKNLFNDLFKIKY